MKVIKPVLIGAGLLAGLWVLFLLSMMLVTQIPRDAYAENLTEAAEFYETADMFETLIDGRGETTLHHYADAVLLNILWNFDADKPLRSVLDSAYYAEKDATQGQNLAETVRGAEANVSYARYWHGMLLFVAPLLCFLPLNGVKAVGAVLLAALVAAHLILLWRRGQRAAAAVSAAGLILCWVWVVPLCIEYYSCFALAFLFADLILWKDGRLRRAYLLFIAAGALTCFFDFLTCEILTLGVPLVCLLLVRRESGKGAFFTAVQNCIAWLAAYALTWLCRWTLAAAVLGRPLHDVALAQGMLRLTGDLGVSVDVGFQPLAAVTVNLSFIFPMSMAEGARAIWTVFIMICIVLVCAWYSFRRRGGDCGPWLMLLCIALIPFLRFFVVSNHAALHPFFTFRDLYLTIIAVGSAMACSVGQPKKASAGRKRRRR